MAITRPLLAAWALAAAACQPTASAPEWHQEPGYRWRELTVSRGGPGFTPLSSARTGIEFANLVSDSALLRNQLLANGAGVALGDVDGDGLVDLYFCRTEGPNALYLNEGNWKFREVATEAGVALADRASTGAILADIDGDGDLDLLVSALGGPNALFLNDGRGQFAEDTTYLGRGSRRGSSTMTLADVDGNGSLDLYVANYKAYTALDIYSPRERAFEQVVKRTGPDRFEVEPGMRKDYKVIMRHDLGSVVLVQRADPDWFYLNDGKGHFTAEPLARNPRFLDEDGKRLAEEPERFGLAARFYDVNSDGWPDLYVVNDFEDPDQFWINDGRGSFRLIPRLAQRTGSNAGMAVDFGDINRDGLVDFYEIDMLSKDPRQRRTQIPTHTALPKQPGVIDDRPQLQRNTLFLNRGDGTFAQIAEIAGLDASGWSWGTLFLDVDLDGYEDVLVANGNVWDFMDGDTQDRLRSRFTEFDWREQRMTMPRLAVPNYAFRNRGDLTFEDVSERWRFSAGPDISHGMAAADLDGDGDLDVVVNRLGAPALVLSNDSPAPRIAVRLKGRAPNTTGIGAKVRVTGAGANAPVPLQEREMTAGGLYLSSSEPLLSFAAGRADSLDVEVVWRDGSRSRIVARPNRLYEIEQVGNGESGMGSERTPTPHSLLPTPSPLFEDASRTLGHTHTEPVFDDWARQLLLPNSFAQLGPGVSWLDLDNDGDEDLLIGTGRTGTTAVFLNQQGRLVATQLGLADARADQTTLLLVPDGQGGSRLLIGQSSYEAETLEAAISMASVIAVPLDGKGRRSTENTAGIPGDTASIGPLALADYDRDGDLDLFVGGRIVPGLYPLSPSSRLFRNDGRGRFVLDSANSAVLRNIGMVSAALWSDIDQDGDPDLLLAIEWGTIKLFRNDGGRLVSATAVGFEGVYSRWLGLATGDFDGDGRPDLVSTSWGRNIRTQADSVRPLYQYFGDFDSNGSLDLLLAQDDPRLGGPAPLASFGRLSRAIPGITQRLRSFEAFADATVDQVLGRTVPNTMRLGATSFEHLVWLNRGTHFEPHPLPLMAQLAPAFAPVVADFDGDGNEDLVLSQNFFPTDLETPRYDAGRALLLLGDGRGGFRPVPGQASGLLVYGDQRGAAAADYDGDGRPDLVITQNGAATRLFRNQGGRTGLRVRLEGPPGNPHGVGASLRLRFGERSGPVREIQAGSGYWSVNGATQVLGLSTMPTALWIRRPDGKESEIPLAAGTGEIRVGPDGKTVIRPAVAPPGWRP